MKTTMKTIVMVLCLLFSISALALTKDEIKQSLNQMRETGMFTEEQLGAAEKKLMEMSPADTNAISKKGMEAAQDPKMQAKAQKIVERLRKEKEKSK